MMTNADCTLYKYRKDGGFDRYFVGGVYWHENKAGNVLKSGLQTADSTTVYFYSDSFLPLSPTKDMLVKGDCPFVFDNSTEKTVSDSMKQFRSLYRFITVMSVDDYFFGGNAHFEVSGK